MHVLLLIHELLCYDRKYDEIKIYELIYKKINIKILSLTYYC